jgi:hypothetical protein
MKIWADVYDPTNTTRQGAGPIALMDATIKRVLDGPGTVSITVPLWEKRAVDLLIVKRVVRVYTDGSQATNYAKRQIGAFVVDDVNRGDDGNKSMTASGKDLLSLLRNKLTGLGRTYDDQDGGTIITSLLSLAGWTTNNVTMGNTSRRFDRFNILKAVQSICEEKNYHFRLDNTTANKIELGQFGDDSGIRAINPGSLPRDIYTNENVLLITSITKKSAGAELVNAVLPLGAGDGDAALTIENSTRGRSTTQTGGDGRDEYWLEDATSIATYGRIEKPLDLKQISPITNSSSDVAAAATAVDDAAWTWLQRHKDPREEYEISCTKIGSVPAVGDKIRVDYRGEIVVFGDEPDADTSEIEKIRDDFYVISVLERWGVGGGNLTLEISNVDDASIGGEAAILVGSAESVQVQGIAIKSTLQTYSYVYRRIIGEGSSKRARVPIRISDAILDIVRCIVYINTDVLQSPNRASSNYTGSISGKTEDANPTTPHDHIVSIASGDGGTHLHDLLWAPVEDDVYPQDLRIYINNVDKTSELSGPWATGGNSRVDFQVEISDILKNDFSLQQEHRIDVIAMESGARGEIEFTIELTVLTQTINLS